jgi:hypothetical protein
MGFLYTRGDDVRYAAQESGHTLVNDIAAVIPIRHPSTPFIYNHNSE